MLFFIYKDPYQRAIKKVALWIYRRDRMGNSFNYCCNIGGNLCYYKSHVDINYDIRNVISNTMLTDAEVRKLDKKIRRWLPCMTQTVS